jgi:hypothetical protein
VQNLQDSFVLLYFLTRGRSNDAAPKCGFTKNLNNCKSVNYAIHAYNQDNKVYALAVVLGICQDITVLRLGLTVIYSDIKTTLYTVSNDQSTTGRITSGFAGPGSTFTGRMDTLRLMQTANKTIKTETKLSASFVQHGPYPHKTCCQFRKAGLVHKISRNRNAVL